MGWGGGGWGVGGWGWVGGGGGLASINKMIIKK